jgi:hypothetical protein
MEQTLRPSTRPSLPVCTCGHTCHLKGRNDLAQLPYFVRVRRVRRVAVANIKLAVEQRATQLTLASMLATWLPKAVADVLTNAPWNSDALALSKESESCLHVMPVHEVPCGTSSFPLRITKFLRVINLLLLLFKVHGETMQRLHCCADLLVPQPWRRLARRAQQAMQRADLAPAANRERRRNHRRPR